MTEANRLNINSIGYKVSNKEYLDKLRQYEIISLSMNIDLKKYAKVEECEFDIKGLASEIIRLKEMESTTAVRLLIKIVELARSQDELGKFRDLIKTIRSGLVLNQNVIGGILKNHIYSLEELG